jgi:hypothetical protein
MDHEEQDREEQQTVWGTLAKGLAGFAGLIFFLPSRAFATNWASGLMIQLGVMAVLILLAVVCWHFDD